MHEKPRKADQPPLIKLEHTFSHDPRAIDGLIINGVSNFHVYWRSLSEKNKVAFAHDVLRARGVDENYAKSIGFTEEVLEQYPTIADQVVFHSDIIYTLFTYFQSYKEEPFEKALEQIAQRQLLKLYVGSIELDENRVKLLSPHSLNELTAWYVDRAYADIDSVIASIKDFPQVEVKKRVESLAILGYLFRKLDQSNPNAKYYQQVLAPFLDEDSLNLLREYIPPVNLAQLDTPRLNMLKGFWHQAFVTQWVASAKLDHDGIGLLTIPDRQRATQLLAPDNRTSETRSGAVNQANAIYGKTGKIETRDAVIRGYDLERRQVELDESKAHKNLLSYTDTLIKLYNPKHMALIDHRNRPVQNWHYFRQKAGRVFEVFVKNTSSLASKETTSQKAEEIVSKTAKELIQVLETKSGDLQLNPQELFGADFFALSPLEQTCLIVFTSLALAGRKDKPEQAVYLISHRLQHLLAEQHDNLPIQKPEIEEISPLNPIKYWKKVNFSKARLNALQKSDGLLSCEEDEIVTELDKRTGIALDIIEAIRSEQGRKTIVKDRHQIKYTLSLGALCAMVFGNEFYALLVADSDMTRNPYPVLALVTALGAIEIGGSYTELLKYSGLKDAERELKKIEILSDSFREKTKAILEKKSFKEIRSRKWLASALLAMFFLGFGINLMDDMSEGGGGRTTIVEKDGSSAHAEASPIPESIDSESLNSLEHKFEGSILHLPKGYSNYDGAAIGYKPNAWLRMDGTVYEDQSRQPFAETKIVPDINQVDLDIVEHQLVYKLGRIGRIIYPLDDHRIVRIIQQGGQQPKIGGTGELYYDGEEAVPEELIIVSERLPDPTPHSSNTSIRQHENMRTAEYDPWNNWDQKRNQALDINAQLSNDPELQSLHYQMIEAADLQNNQLVRGEVDAVEIRGMWSRLATSYAIKFAAYVNTHRYYSLKFNSDGISGDSPTLTAVSDNPNQGFFCVVGNVSFQEFMSAIDVHVVTRPGATLYNYDSELLSRIGHMNSSILLPNGQVVLADMTPSRPMPGEDLSSLAEFPPPADRKEEVLKRIGVFAGTIAISGATIYGHKEVKKKLKKRSFEEKIDTDLPDDEKEAKQILLTVEHLLLYIKEVANEERWQQYSSSGRFQTREELYKALASDALGLLVRDGNLAGKPADIEDQIESLKRAKRMKDKSVPALPSSERRQVKDALKIVRRNLKELEQNEKNRLNSEKQQLEVQLNYLIQSYYEVEHLLESEIDDSQKRILQDQHKVFVEHLEVLRNDLEMIDSRLAKVANLKTTALILRRILEETR